MGVRMIKKTRKYRAEVKVRGKRYSKNFRTKEEALAWLETIKQIKTGHSGSNQYERRMTVRYAFAILIELCERKNFDERTIDSYFEALKLLEPILDIEISELQPRDIEKTFSQMRNSRTGDYLSRSRIYKTLGKLTRALDIAGRKGIVMEKFEEAEASVVGFIESTSPEVVPKSPYTIEEVKKLIDYQAPKGTEPYWVVPLIKILLMTGKRIGEVLGLTDDKINHKDLTIDISQMVTNSIYKKRLKGKGKPHTIKMDSELSQVIKDLQKLNEERCPGSSWLFPPRQYKWVGDFPRKYNCPYKGRPIRRSSVDKFVKLRMKASGVRIINIHGFRKTYATLRAIHLLKSGNLFAREIIKKELNHKKATTTDLYIDIADSYLQESKKENVLSTLNDNASTVDRSNPKDALRELGIDVDNYDWDILKNLLITVGKLSKK
jgi:integrase